MHKVKVRTAQLVLILAMSCLIVVAAATVIIWRMHLREARSVLVATVQSQARLIEVLAESDRSHLIGLEMTEQEIEQVTISQLIEAHKKFVGFGETGEFTFAQKEADQIVFLFKSRHDIDEIPKQIPFDSNLAEPMRLALQGKSGSVIGLDCRGVMVVAAYEPVPMLSMGIVAKEDLSEVRAPFCLAWTVASAIAIVVVLVGVWLIFLTTYPLINHLEKHAVKLEEEIENRKGVEHSLRESEEKYRNLFDSSVVGVVISLASGEILASNKAMTEITGYTPEDYSQIKMNEVYINPEDRNRYYEIMGRNGVVENFETGLRKKNNESIWVSLSGRLIIFEGVRAFFNTVLDITERKQAEELSALLQERNELILNAAHEGIFGLDIDGNTTFVNPAAAKLIGWEPEELIGKNQHMILHHTRPDGTPFPAEECLVYAALKDGTVHTVDDEVFWRKDGSSFPVEYTNAPIFDNNGKITGAVVTFSDITKRIQAGEEKLRLEGQVMQTQKLEAIGTLAGGVAHEINNPIMGIMNYSQLIFDGLKDENPLREYSSEIIHETKRVAKIVRNLLTFARDEKQEHSTAHLADIVNNTMSLVQTILRHDQITLEVDIPGNVHSIKCRSQQIQQVLMNLITNARDALNEKYPQYHPNKIIRIDVIGFERDGQEWTRTSVEDNGIGLSKEVKERMFDPFFTTKEPGKGTGLGLSINHSIIKDHEGKLYAESGEESGTRLIMELPVDNGWDMGKPDDTEEQNPHG